MTRLSFKAAAHLARSLEVLHADVEPAALFGRLARAATLAIDAETSCFDGFNPAGGLGHLGSHPQDTWAEADFPALQQHLPQHPLFPEIIGRRRSEPLRTSDFCRMERFFRTALYNEFYRPYALTHQLIVGLAVPGNGWITCALNRHRRDFTDDERAVFGLLKPHFAVAIRNARTVARLREVPQAPVLAAAVTGLARVNATGSLLSADVVAERLLRVHFGVSGVAARLLPGPLLWWLHQCRAAPFAAPPDFTHRTEHAELSVRLVPVANAGELLLLLEERTVPSAAALQRLGLTAREADVLFHLALGLSDKAISHACGISLRTVQNHLQNIYTKLGVDNRTAAVLRAVAAA